MTSRAFYTLYLVLISALFIALLAISTSQAHAQAKIAVVNIQKIMRESKAAEAVRQQLKSKQQSFQSELDKKEAELQKEDQELAKQRTVLSQEAFEAKYKDFRQKAAAAQAEVRTKRGALDKGFTKALADIQKKVTDIVASVAKEKGLDVAIAASPILYVNPTMDITQPVLERLNKEMPNLTVNFN